MVKVYRGVVQTQDYINNCAATNAYSSNPYPQDYVQRQQREAKMSMYSPSAFDARRTMPYYPPADMYYRPRRDPYRRVPPPAPPKLRIVDEPPSTSRRGRGSWTSSSSAATTPLSPPPRPQPPPSSKQRRKSVTFGDYAKPNLYPERPKSFAPDAPPVAISESAKQTSRRLFYRKPSEGGRPSARPGVPRKESIHSLNTVRAEMGTPVGRPSRRGESERERERDRRDRDYHRSKGSRR